MKALLLNQTFYPDVASTGQHLADLARGLAAAGHQVTVVTSRRAYDNPLQHFPARETWNGIEIHRVAATGFGKRAKWRRALDFASFMVSCALRSLFTPRPDVVMALTSPPLISFLGAWIARLRGARFIYWVMDLNPDEAIVAGWLREGSALTRLLQRISHFSLQRAHAIVVLDRFMRDRILAKGIPAGKIHVIAPWSHDDAVKFDAPGRERFRAKHGLAGKFVVMYSGNHSPCHPLDTLMEAARLLAQPQPPSPISHLPSPNSISFCFVGGGSEFARVQKFAATHGLTNITCLPYQPLAELSGSLSAADLHVVVMGDPFIGTIHPCKIYNILIIGAPTLYIGPRPSHITDLIDQAGPTAPIYAAAHGDVAALVQHILRAAQSSAPRDGQRFQKLGHTFSRQTLLPGLLRLFEATPPQPQASP